MLPASGCWLPPRVERRVEPQVDEDADLTDLSLEDLMELEFEMPVSVLGAHTHREGEIMFGLTEMFMNMSGSRDGRHSLSNSEVLEMYPTAHTKMYMQMTMLSAMYAPTDDTTFMAMLPKVRKEAHHLRMDGSTFKVISEGVGDAQVHVLHTFYREGEHRMHFDAGVSIPTGTIDFDGGDHREHYMQQLGSGTYDLLPGITYLGETENWAWGAQASSVVRLGENKNCYTLGNRYALTSWIMRRIHRDLAVSLRLNGQHWGNVRGRDPDLDPAAISENDPGHYGGNRVDALVGVNFYGTEGALQGHRVEFEAGVPVYQSLDGPQLEVDFIAMASWKFVF